MAIRLIETAAPARLAGIAEDEGVWVEPGSDKTPCGRWSRKSGQCDATPIRCPWRSRKPWGEPRIGRSNLKRDEFDTRGQRRADQFGLAGPAHGIAPRELLGRSCNPPAKYPTGKGRRFANFRKQNLAQLGVGIDQEEMVGRRRSNPLGDPMADCGSGQIELTHGAKEAGDVLIEDLFRGGWRSVLART
jgi:hypothetical protein